MAPPSRGGPIPTGGGHIRPSRDTSPYSSPFRGPLSAHTGQSRPDSGLGFQVKVFEKSSRCSLFAPTRPPERKRKPHPGGNSGANLKSISHMCYLREVAFEWELTKETINLPLGCLQGGYKPPSLSSSLDKSHASEKGIKPCTTSDTPHNSPEKGSLCRRAAGGRAGLVGISGEVPEWRMTACPTRPLPFCLAGPMSAARESTRLRKRGVRF